MPFRWTVGISAVATAAALFASPLPAAADETALVITGLDDPVLLDYTGDAFDITLPAQQGGTQTGSQCIDGAVATQDPTKACIGYATPTEQPPLSFGGIGDLSPLIKSGNGAEGALGWIVADAIQAVRIAHDVPNDSRIERFARGEIRAHILDTLLSIMDKKVYGVPLTTDESRALAWVESQSLDRDRFLAAKAYEEYEAFTSSPCTYQPPPAPSVVTKPETVPKVVTNWCRTHSQIADQVTIAPPLPTAAQFTAWASYRYADRLGLTAFSDPVVTKNMIGLALGVTTFAAFGVAAAVGAATFYLSIATGAAATLGAKLFPYAARSFFRQGASQLIRLFAKLAAEGSSAWAGAIAAAFIAGVVVVALVVIGVATYLVVQHAAVASALKQTIADTAKSSDPFGLGPLQEKLAGLPLNSELDDEVPGYRKGTLYEQLAAQVVLWTTLDKDGHAVPDPSGIWSNSAPGVDDPQWIMRVGDAPAVQRDRIRIPQHDDEGDLVYPNVSVSQGWFVVTEPTRPSRPALSFGYLDEDDVARVAQRAPRSVGGFLLTDTENASSSQVTNLTFRNADGELVRARLQRLPSASVAGPRPTAVGPMWAGRPVMLRPNPVGTNGASLDPDVVQEDYTFDWTVERLDAETDEWTEVSVPDGYGTSFVPTQPGEYDARVTMTADGAPTDQRFGSVRFTVTSPPIHAPVLTLQDDGEQRLELDLQLQEEIASDHVTVQVTWPGALGSDDDPVTTLEQECFQTGPLECTTQRTGPSNLLVRDLPDDADLTRPVTLTVTNSTGGVVRQEFHIGAGRPSLVAPPAGVNDDEPGTAHLDGNTIQVEMPLDDTAGVQDYTAARLVPSAGGQQTFNLLDPETGNTTGAIQLPGSRNLVAQVFLDGGSWYLELTGTPKAGDLGSYEVPLVIGQTNSTRTTALAAIHVVPSTDGRRRAALLTDVDPDDNGTAVPPLLEPAILGGVAGQPAYTGDLCVSLQDRNQGAPPVQQCRTSADWVGTQGTAVPFPFAELFPRGMETGSWEAKAWLAEPGETVDVRPLAVPFFLTEEASYPPPKVSLTDVTIGGNARVGRTLTARVGSVRPAAANLTYRWLRDGKAITGATGETYVLKRADRGHRLQVKVVAKVPDWTKAQRTSAKTAVVR